MGRDLTGASPSQAPIPSGALAGPAGPKPREPLSAVPEASKRRNEADHAWYWEPTHFPKVENGAPEK